MERPPYPVNSGQNPPSHAERTHRKKNAPAIAIFFAVVMALALAAGLLFSNHNAEGSPLNFSEILHGEWQSESATLSAGLSTELPANAYIDGVPYIDQHDGYEAGCESASAVMALNFAGYDITVDEFIDNYLPIGDAPYMLDDGTQLGCDPWEKFPGDPRTDEGWGCYSPVIERAVNDYLSSSSGSALRLENVPLETLCADYITNNIPVLIWATIDMEVPTYYTSWTVPESGREIDWIYPMHCLVLIGYDETSYIFNDPWAGESIYYPKEAVQVSYEGLYMQALVINSQN